jgi:hypothetical protein
MECINISVFGDTIYVANGTYKEQVVMIPGLSLIGAGMDSCVIDTKELISTTGDISVEFFDNCLLKGFKIICANNTEIGQGIGGSGNQSLITFNLVIDALYGISVGSTQTISYNICQNITIGLDLFNSNALIKNNFIFSKTEFESGITGIIIEAFNFNYFPIIDSNYIETIYYGIWVFFGNKPTITNNTIVLKGEDASGIVISGNSDTVKIFNNKVIAEIGHIGFNNDLIPILEYNNYLTGNFDDFFNQFAVINVNPNNQIKNNVITNAERGITTINNPNPIVYNNDSWSNDDNYWGFTPDSTNLSVDPMIASEDSNDFHLQKYSPLIDKGDPNIHDVDGTRSDIGLYGGPFGEQYHYVDLAPRTPINLNATLDSLTIGITWNKNTEPDFNHYNVYRDTTKNFEIDSTNLFLSTPVANLIDILPDYVEKIYYKITAVDNQSNESEPSEEVGFILTSTTDQQQTISDFRLYQNYPNPFNPSTKISYRLKVRGYVKLYVYDIKGELVSVLVNQTQEAGFYEVDFSSEVGSGQSAVGNQLSSGIYIYQIMVKNENNIPVFTDMKKMLYLK